MKQHSFASLSYSAKKKKTRKEAFLEQMEACVPWAAFEAVIAPTIRARVGAAANPLA